MKEIGLRSYQDIKGPDELEEERMRDSIYESLLRDFDPDCGSFTAYQSWCRKEARRIASAEMQEEEE